MLELLISVLEEMGYVILEKEGEDFSISDYISDSIQFISFIINIEDKIGVELTDDFLRYDIMHSAIGFANMLNEYLTSKDNSSLGKTSTEVTSIEMGEKQSQSNEKSCK